MLISLGPETETLSRSCFESSSIAFNAALNDTSDYLNCSQINKIIATLQFIRVFNH